MWFLFFMWTVVVVCEKETTKKLRKFDILIKCRIK